MGNDTELIKLRDEVKTQTYFRLEGDKKNNNMIPLEKIAAIAAGLVYSDNMTSFEIGGKSNMRKKNYLIKYLNKKQ